MSSEAEPLTMARLVEQREKLMNLWDEALQTAKSTGYWDDVHACGKLIDAFHNTIARGFQDGKFLGDTPTVMKMWDDIHQSELNYRRLAETEARLVAPQRDPSTRSMVLGVSPDAQQDSVRSQQSAFHSGPELVGSLLLFQFLSNDGPLVSSSELEQFSVPFDPAMRTCVQSWQRLFAAWLLKLLADAKFGQEFGRRAMASTYGRLASNEDRAPEGAGLAASIKYWFSEMDNASQHAAKNPARVQGETLPVSWHFAMLFLIRDTGHPYSQRAPNFDGLDLDVMEALARVQDAVKPRIDAILEDADRLPR
ncbi:MULTISPECIES: hypothetical protein [unclassified Bradyrhizobium]|uniref:hypothetical protein n=1 Tax=unclassified Bradyrhizobium TaxID=2631580 RepID=UPI0028E89CBB|nr:MULTISPECIES: hypothetical protein [unclassified Bradyrhizobium]